jgi:MFS family permease
MEKQNEKSLVYAWYVVIVLMLANISSFIDRQILALLVAPIKRDLHLSDTQMSLLMGLSFALFYTIFGILIGHLSDKFNRRNIVIYAVGLIRIRNFSSFVWASASVKRRFRRRLIR